MKITSTKNIGHDTLKIIVYGESGAGKTTLAKTIGEPTLIISAEAGLLSIADHDIDVVDITTDNDGKIVPREHRIDRIKEVYTYLLSAEAKKKYRWIFIDSLTEISQNLVEGLQREFPERKDALVLWGEYSKRQRGLVKGFRDMPYNVVMTALNKISKDELNRKHCAIDVAGKSSDQLPAIFDLVLYLHSDKDAEGNVKRALVTAKTENMVAKDRSGKLLPMERPDLSLIVKKIKGETK